MCISEQRAFQGFCLNIVKPGEGAKHSSPQMQSCACVLTLFYQPLAGFFFFNVYKTPVSLSLKCGLILPMQAMLFQGLNEIMHVKLLALCAGYIFY